MSFLKTKRNKFLSIVIVCVILLQIIMPVIPLKSYAATNDGTVNTELGSIIMRTDATTITPGVPVNIEIYIDGTDIYGIMGYFNYDRNIFEDLKLDDIKGLPNGWKIDNAVMIGNGEAYIEDVGYEIVLCHSDNVGISNFTACIIELTPKKSVESTTFELNYAVITDVNRNDTQGENGEGDNVIFDYTAQPASSTLTVNPNGGTWESSTSSTTVTGQEGETRVIPDPTAPLVANRINYVANGGTLTKLTEDQLAEFKEWTGATLTQNTSGENVYTFGSNNETLTANYEGNDIILPNATKVGSEFQGWSTDVQGQNIIGRYGDTYKPEYTRPNNAITLYAQYTDNLYNLEIDPNGGTYKGDKNPTKIIGKKYKDEVAIVTPVAPEGYTVVLNKNDGTTSKTTVKQVNSFDRWIKTGKGNFSDGVYTFGDSDGTLTAEYIRNNVDLGTSTRTGYRFEGWFTDPIDGTQVTSPYLPQSDNVQLYAHWTPTTHKVTFDENGGTKTNPTFIMVTYDSIYGTLPTTTKQGYTFDGWYDKNNNKITADTVVNIVEDEIVLTARWIGSQYTVTFNAGEGTTPIPTSKLVTNGEIYGELATTSRDGYEFKGWYTDENGQGTKIESTTTVSISSDITLYAHWEGKQYTVRFEPEGGNAPNPSDTISVKNGTTYGNLPTTDRAGYTFKGWYTQREGQGDKIESTTQVNVTSNTTLYAHWEGNEYTVTFDSDGGTTPSMLTKTVKNGQQYGELATTTKTGFEFKGWYTQQNGQGDRIDPTTIVNITDPITLYASWGGNQNIVTFDADGGTTPQIIDDDGVTKEMTSKPVTNGGTYGKLPTTTKPGYTFKGWYTQQNGQGQKIDPTTQVNTTQDITVYASWEGNEYTLTFEEEGGTAPVKVETNGTTTPMKTKMVKNGEQYQDLATTDRVGYTFEGWYTQREGKGDKIESTTVVNITSDISVYASWKAKEYTVTFNPDGGTVNPTSKQVKYNEAYGELPTPTKDGYQFKGWYNANGDKVESTTVLSVAENVTLTAQWEAEEYTVTFNPDGGTVDPTSKPIKYNEAYGELPTPTKDGYQFKGWYNANGDKVESTTVLSVAEDVTLTAQWEAKEYTITFDPDDGTTPTPFTTKKVTYGEQYQDLPTTTKQGFQFKGWYTEKNGQGQQIEATGIVDITGDITVYASWGGNENTVTFDPDGGTTPVIIDDDGVTKEMTSKPVTNGGTYGKLPTTTKPGYTFKGWFTEREGKGQKIIPSITVSTTQNITLYASWEGNEYTLTFEEEGGTAPVKVETDGTTTTMKTKKVKNGEQYQDLATTDREGYTFGGWYTQREGKGDKIESTTVVNITSDISVYASWEAKEYTVTFNPDGGTVNPTSKQVKYNEAYGELPTPTKTGFEFKGWYNANGDKVESTTILNVADNVTLTAQWETKGYTVTFNPDGGTVNPTSKPIKYNEAYGELPTPTKEGYEFKGWYNANGNKVESTTIVDVVDNVTLTAQWEAKKYTITFDPDDGTTPTPFTTKQVTYGDTYKDLPTTTKTGFEFKGWYTQKNGQGEKIESTGIVNITGDITVYANWGGNENTLTFDPDGGTTPVIIDDDGVTKEMTSKTITNGSTYGRLPSTTKPGYTFKGWFTQKNGQGQKIDPKMVVNATQDMTLYASWEGNEYTVTFEPEGGTAPVKVEADGITKTPMPSKTVKNGDQYQVLPITDRVGYTFKGWYTQREGKGDKIEVTTVVNITSNISLYANWEANKYTVTFNPGDGTLPEVEKQKEVTYDEPYGTLPTPTRPGYEFKGWLDEAGNEVKPEDIVKITAPTTLTAKWEQKKHTVTFKNDDGTVIKVVEAVDGSKVEFDGQVPTKPNVRPGYQAVFKEWKNADKLANVTEDIIVEAVYEETPIEYTITYQDLKGSDNSQNPVKYTVESTNLQLVNLPDQEKYIFKGWYTTDDENGVKVTSIDVSKLENIILYARWEEKQPLDPTDRLYLKSDKYKVGEKDIDNYEVGDVYLDKIEPQTTVAEFIRNCESNGTITVVTVIDGKEVVLKDNDLVGTNMTIKTTGFGETFVLTAVVMGDLDGDGKVTPTDLSTLNQAVLKDIKLEGAFFKAADLDDNENLTPTDLSTINNTILKNIVLTYKKVVNKQ